jgi:hypothetical protein
VSSSSEKDVHFKSPPPSLPMLSPDEFKKALGQAAENYTEQQLEWLRDFCDRFADLFFDAWLSGRNVHNEENHYGQDRSAHK